MILTTPWVIFLIPFVLILVYGMKKINKPSSLRFPSVDLVSSLNQTWKTRLIRLPFYFRLLAMVLFILALAGPRSVSKETMFKSEGIDIVLTMDASGSMMAEDFTIKKKRTNRLDVVKSVVKDFIEIRKNDRIGLIAFAGLAYTVSPLTTDYSWLSTNLDRIDFLTDEGTAIGSAIASSLARLAKSKAKSKIIILLTDGENTTGKIDPLVAAQAAEALGIKIYTIGAGTKGYAQVPYARDIFGKLVYRPEKVNIDEKSLRKIAEITKGKYFRATSTTDLRDIYKEIDAMEKTEIKEFGYTEYGELFVYVLGAGLLLLLCELLLSNTILLRLP